jgi:acyl-CoA synthetase (AMP-forming)/AMP-acid ligase II
LDLAALRLKVVVAGFEPGKFTDAGELVARYGLTVLFTDRDVPADAPAAVRPFTDVAEAARQVWPEPPGPVVYEPEDVTTIKFTSGSTGAPKGLGATVGSIDASMQAVQEIFEHRGGDNLFVFLPLSLLQQRYWLYSALCFGHDATVTTYEAAFAALGMARPTVVMGVPAFFEAAKQQISQDAARADGVAPEAARRAAARRLFGDRIRYLWTGSAPADREVLRYLTDAGLPIYEGYGLNETCIVSKNHPGAHRMGSVGRVLRGKEVLFDEDGVILVRSEHPVNQHYEFAEPGDSERMFPRRTGWCAPVTSVTWTRTASCSSGGAPTDVIVLGERQEGHRPADRGAHADESGDRGVCGVLPRADVTGGGGLAFLRHGRPRGDRRTTGPHQRLVRP